MERPQAPETRIHSSRPSVGRRFSLIVLLVLAAELGHTETRPDAAELSRLRSLPPDTAIAEVLSLADSEAYLYAIALFQSALQRGSREEADRFLDTAAAIAQRGGLAAEYGEVMSTRAYIEQLRGNTSGAIDIMRDAVVHYARAQLEREQINALMFLGNLQHGLGTLSDALETIESVIAREAEIEGELVLAHAFSESAMLRYKLGRLDGVVAHLNRALPLYQAHNNENGIGTVYRIFGNYHNSRGETQTALEYYERARVHYINTNNVHDYANISFNIGLVFLQTGSAAAAIPYLENAIENFSSAGSLSGAGMAGTELGRALYQLRRLDEAETIVLQTRRNLEASQSYLRLAQAHAMYAAIRFTRGDEAGALEAYGDALRLYRRLRLPEEESRILETMLRIRQGTQGEIEL